MSILIRNATIINEGEIFIGCVYIKDQYINKIYRNSEQLPSADIKINAENHLLIPGIIDDQVHFREPGLTHKGDIATESRAGIAGGVTSFMEMPNTIPQATTIEELENKYKIASQHSPANYSFYMGATNHNLKELLKVDSEKVCGIKVFMGSSTGNMLVDNKQMLNSLFKEMRMLITTHCEDENIIKTNMANYRQQYGENMPFRFHPSIRNAEACYNSSAMAAELAEKYNSRLHILHLSTEREMSLLRNDVPIEEKKITGEVCVHHLWFDDSDYDRLGSRIKWNPAIKSIHDRDALRKALKNNKLDVIATDHAPHTLEEKNQNYFNAPSGSPLIQHSLNAMLELAEKDIFTKEMIVDKMCHAPSRLFRINKRGFIREGYFADLVLIKPNSPWNVTDESVLYKCKWSPFTGETFSNKVTHTFINGYLAYENGRFNDFRAGERMTFLVEN